MLRFITNVALNLAVFLACAMLFPNGFHLENMGAAAVAALVLAVLNVVLKPILLLLSLPLVIVTMGIFLIVVNTILLEITAHLVGGFAFSSFWWAMLVAIILAVVSFIFSDRKQVKIERE